MSYQKACDKILREEGVVLSTMMGTPCLRYKKDFIAMMFDKADALIIKVSADRVNELIDDGVGLEFNFTKKKFKNWVLIPLEFQDDYDTYIVEALEFAKG